jgi:hypothetical protein
VSCGAISRPRRDPGVRSLALLVAVVVVLSLFVGCSGEQGDDARTLEPPVSVEGTGTALPPPRAESPVPGGTAPGTSSTTTFTVKPTSQVPPSTGPSVTLPQVPEPPDTSEPPGR